MGAQKSTHPRRHATQWWTQQRPSRMQQPLSGADGPNSACFACFASCTYFSTSSSWSFSSSLWKMFHPMLPDVLWRPALVSTGRPKNHQKMC